MIITGEKALVANEHQRIRELLEEVSDKNMNEQKQVLENTLAEWQGENEQADDILVIGIKI